MLTYVLLQLEAALRCGVDLDELYSKDLPYFVERAEGHKVNLAKVMAQHYEERRKLYIADVKLERRKVAQELANAAQAERERLQKLATMPDEEKRRLAMQAKNNIEAERKRMEFL